MEIAERGIELRQKNGIIIIGTIYIEKDKTKITLPFKADVIDTGVEADFILNPEDNTFRAVRMARIFGTENKETE